MEHSLLFVDDEESILNSLVRIFRKEGYELFTASSGMEGIEIVEKNDISLIISDYRMPGMSGVDFLFQAKEIIPDAIRIMLTGYADLQASIDAINKGEVYRFISKPWNCDELKMTVRQSFEYRDLLLANRSLARTVRHQAQIFNKLEERHPGITSLKKADNGAIIVDESDYENFKFEELTYMS